MEKINYMENTEQPSFTNGEIISIVLYYLKKCNDRGDPFYIVDAFGFFLITNYSIHRIYNSVHLVHQFFFIVYACYRKLYFYFSVFDSFTVHAFFSSTFFFCHLSAQSGNCKQPQQQSKKS